MLGVVQTIGGTAPPGSSSVGLRGGAGDDLVAYVQDDPAGQVQAHLHGGDGDDIAASVLLSGQPPTVNGFATLESFSSIADIFAAYADKLDRLIIWLL